MPIYAGVLNGNNNNNDYQFQAGISAILNQGVISGLAVTSGQVGTGSALVSVTRGSFTFLLAVHNTSAVSITTTGTTKVWLAIDQAKIDDNSAGAADGTGVASIQTGASYPGSGSFIKLASITSGVITDERSFVSPKMNNVGIQEPSVATIPSKYNGYQTTYEICSGNNGAYTNNLGLTGGGANFYMVVTQRFWDASSTVRQVAYGVGNNEIWSRTGATDTTWNTWVKVYPVDISVTGGGYNFATYESGMSSGNPVGLVYDDGIMKCTTENKSSANISASTIVTKCQQKLDATRTLFIYTNGNSLRAIVGTLSGDTMSYGSEATIYNASATVVAGCALIGTDKVAVGYTSATAGDTMRKMVLSISGTTISNGTELSDGFSNGYSGNQAIGAVSVCRIRDNAFAASFWTGSYSIAATYTVSGTTITYGTTILHSVATSSGSWALGNQLEYLSDNRIAYYVGFPTSGNVGQVNSYLGSGYTNLYYANQGVHIYTVNGSGSNITEDLVANTNINTTPYFARYDDSSVLVTFPATNTNTNLYTKNGAAINAYTLFDNGASVFAPVVSIADNVFGVINGTTMKVYQRDILIGTISNLSIPTDTYQWKYIKRIKGRLVYPNGSNGTMRIVSLAIVCYIGLSSTGTGDTIFRGAMTISGTIAGTMYYVQPDGTIGPAFSSKYVGRGIATNILQVG